MNTNTNNNSNSKQFYLNFLDKLVEDNIITTFCKNKLIDLLNTNKPKNIYLKSILMPCSICLMYYNKIYNNNICLKI